MKTSKFGFPSRYDDRGTKDIVDTFRYQDIVRSVATSYACRFLRSPPGLAPLLQQACKQDMPAIVASATQGMAYIQSGVSQTAISKQMFVVAEKIIADCPAGSLEDLEDKIVEVSPGAKGEHFAARQVAADLVRLGFVRGVPRKGIPATCRFGLGGHKGHRLSRRFGGEPEPSSTVCDLPDRLLRTLDLIGFVFVGVPSVAYACWVRLVFFLFLGWRKQGVREIGETVQFWYTTGGSVCALRAAQKK